MGKKFNKSRKTYKVNTLSEELRLEVDKMLTDTNYTYNDISKFLSEKGYKISVSAIGRYALDRNKTIAKIIQAQEQAKVLAEIIKNNKEEDYTEAGLQIITAELTKRLAEANSDIEKMDIKDATKLLTNLARIKTLKEKTETDIKNKKELAFEVFEEEIFKKIGNKKELQAEFYSLLKKIKEVED